MKTVLLVSKDSTLAELMKSALPEEWRLMCVASGGLASQCVVENGSPALLAMDTEIEGGDGLTALEALREALGPTTHVVLLAPERVSEETKTRAATMKVSDIVTRPITRERIDRLISSFLGEREEAAMTLPEILGAGFADTAAKRYSFQADTSVVALFFSRGLLWKLDHPLFEEKYRRALQEAGIDLSEAPPEKSWLGLAALEEKVGPSSRLQSVKQATILSVLASCPTGSSLKVVVDDAIVPEGLVPVDIPSLLLELLDHVPLETLSGLTAPRVRLKTTGEVIPEDLHIRSHHGYLLSQCASPHSASELIQTGILPKEQVLTGLYLLLLLGLLRTEPPQEGPFTIATLVKATEKEERVIRVQSQAIQAMVRSFQSPGQNPYEVLGVPPKSSPQEAFQACEKLQEKLGPENLHPEVYRRHQRDILLVKAKVNEAYLLLQSSFLESRNARMKEAADSLEEGPSRLGTRKTGRQKQAELRIREARRMLAMAKEMYEEERWHDASQHLHLSLLEDPLCAESHNLMGKLCSKNTNPRARHVAEKEYTRAVELEPFNIDFLLDLAQFYADNDLVARCEAYLDKAQGIELRNPRALAIRKSIKGKG